MASRLVKRVFSSVAHLGSRKGRGEGGPKERPKGGPKGGQAYSPMQPSIGSTEKYGTKLSPPPGHNFLNTPLLWLGIDILALINTVRGTG